MVCFANTYPLDRVIHLLNNRGQIFSLAATRESQAGFVETETSRFSSIFFLLTEVTLLNVHGMVIVSQVDKSLEP